VQTPDLSAPISNTIALSSGAPSKDFWLVSDPVPTDATIGSHTLTVTATMPLYPAAWAVDSMWMGKWIEPPTAIPTYPSLGGALLPRILKR
jgi:hypothetical protein